VESPRREAPSPRIPSNRAEIHTMTLWHFCRAPQRPPADPYRTGHGLPLEFPASSSPETVGTHPSGVVQRSHPSSLPKGCVRVVRSKMSRTLIRPHAHEARGLAPNKLASMKGDQMPHGGLNVGAPLKHNISKALEGVTHSSEASGATPDGCARTHPPKGQ
jgi:hypothetical protein